MEHMEHDGKWMKEAFKNSHGQFAARAKNAGMTTTAYARHVLAHKDRYSMHVQRQAQLAKTGMRMAKRRK